MGMGEEDIIIIHHMILFMLLQVQYFNLGLDSNPQFLYSQMANRGQIIAPVNNKFNQQFLTVIDLYNGGKSIEQTIRSVK